MNRVISLLNWILLVRKAILENQVSTHSQKTHYHPLEIDVGEVREPIWRSFPSSPYLSSVSDMCVPAPKEEKGPKNLPKESFST